MIPTDTPDYVGFDTPDECAVGLGFAFRDAYRNLPWLALQTSDFATENDIEDKLNVAENGWCAACIPRFGKIIWSLTVDHHRPSTCDRE